MWGKGSEDSDVREAISITPTCVGKRLYLRRCDKGTKDHPHVCGEKFTLASSTFGAIGSPPRVWGKDIKRNLGNKFDGITPTCVGKSGPTNV